MEMQPRILVVDDNPEIGKTLKEIFQIYGYLVDIARNGEKGIFLCQNTQYDIAIIDINLPDILGTEVVEKIAEISSSTDIIYITGHATLDSAIEAVKREYIVSYETKPFDNNRILSIIKQIIHRRQAEKALVKERLLLTQRVAERTAELKTTNIKLARVLRLKDEFLASMSHELRTPLQAVLGLSESLLDGIYGSLNEKQQKSIQTIEESGQHLLSLINDILDFSQISAGELELKWAQIQIEELCQKSLNLIRQELQKKALKVTFSIAPTATTMVADPHQLTKILVNLLSNAVKFTHHGGYIGLEVKIDEEEQVIHFSVWDAGIGIAKEDMQRLFQPFVQIDGRLARQYEGTGLGLTLVQYLTELHGGSVNLTSTVDEGSCFTISLPWYKTVEERQLTQEKLMSVLPELAEQNKSRIPTILLVEDNEAHIQTISTYLECNNYKVVIARDGSESLIHIQNVHPDIIIMDIQMPVMDGFEAIQQIRALNEFKKTPIITMTALTMPGDRERCLAMGANEYLSKPISFPTLLKTIQNLL